MAGFRLKRYLSNIYLALIAASVLLSSPAPVAAQVHLGLPSAVKSAVKKLKSKKNTTTVSSIVLGPLTKVLTADTNSKFLGVSAGSTTYHYDIGATQFAALSAGDIMLSSQGNGLLRKIVSITPTATEYTILTTTATLEEAFEKLDVSFSQAFTPSQISPQYLKGVRPQSAPLGQFELSTSVALSPNITADATLTFSPSIDGKIKIDGFQLKEFAFTSIFDGSLELALTATVAETLTKEVKVAEFPLGVIMAGPVPIVANYAIKVGVEATLQAAVTTGVTQEVSFEAGVSYLNGVWTPHTTLDNNFTFTPPVFSAEGSLKAYIAPEINAKILDVAGPYVDAEGYLKGIIATPVNHLPWAVKGGIEINAGVKIEVLSWALAAWNAELYNAEILLSSGALLNQAPVISAVTPAPASILTGAASAITCAASDPDGDSLVYAWSAASGTISGSGSSITWTAPSTPGVYTITVVVTDGYGGSVQNSTNVTVTGVVSGGDWVFVPGNPSFGTSDFYVMKYEAKNVGGVATSQADATPWTNITQTSAIAACAALGTGAHLLTIPETQTINRNIEAQTANWANGTIGSLISAGGGLKRGNAGITDSASYDNSSNPEFGTGRNTKAKHVLSNGGEIWDWSGNVWEWIYGAGTDGELGTPGGFFFTDGIYEWDSVSLNEERPIIGPSNSSWTSVYGVGIYSGGHLTLNSIVRGGHASNGAGSGVFAFNSTAVAANPYTGVGFRCGR